MDAIEAALNEFFLVFQESPEVRELFEIMMSRCEYVDEFACVQSEVGRPAQEFLENMEHTYRQAAVRQTLQTGLEPLTIARDTWAFTSGLLHLLSSCQRDIDLFAQIPGMIAAHVALRRAANS